MTACYIILLFAVERVQQIKFLFKPHAHSHIVCGLFAENFKHVSNCFADEKKTNDCLWVKYLHKLKLSVFSLKISASEAGSLQL